MSFRSFITQQNEEIAINNIENVSNIEVPGMDNTDTIYSIDAYKDIPSVYEHISSTEGFLSDVSDYFIDFFKKIGQFFYNPNPDQFQIATDRFIEESVDTFKKYRSKINNVDFISLAKTPTAYNMIMNKDIYTSAKVLLPVCISTNNSILSLVNNLDTKLTRLVNNPDLLANLKPDLLDKSAFKLIKDGEEVLSTLINSNGRSDTRPLSQVTPNKKAVEDTIVILTDIKAIKMYKTSIELNNISKHIYENINKLILKLNKQNTKVSKQTLSDLVYQLESCAKLVTIYGNLLYLISCTAIGTTNSIHVMVDNKIER